MLVRLAPMALVAAKQIFVDTPRTFAEMDVNIIVSFAVHKNACFTNELSQAMRKLNADHMLLQASKSALSTSAVPNSGTADLPRSSASGKTRKIQRILRVTPSTVDVAT